MPWSTNKALHGLNPIPSLSPSPMTLHVPLLHPHYSMKPVILFLQAAPQLVPSGIFLKCSTLTEASLGRPLRLQPPPPAPKVSILFPLCFICSDHLTYYMFYLSNIFASPPEQRLQMRAGSSALCRVFLFVFFPEHGRYARHSVTVCWANDWII